MSWNQVQIISLASSIADAAAANRNGIKGLLGIGLRTFHIKGNPVFGNSSPSPKNPSDFPISCNWVFDCFMFADETFVKAYQSFETCVLVNNNLCGNLFSSLELPRTFNEIFTSFYSWF